MCSLDAKELIGLWRLNEHNHYEACIDMCGASGGGGVRCIQRHSVLNAVGTSDWFGVINYCKEYRSVTEAE